MSTKPSGNAVKHGLSSLTHLPRGREHELPPILADLTASRQPETPEQVEIVQELAFAMWQRGEADRLFAEQAQPKFVDAEALFNKQTKEAYDALADRYAKNPGMHLEAMAQTVIGVKYFLRIWTNLLSTLADGAAPPSLKHTSTLIKSLGVHPSPVFITGEGEILMKQVLALKPNPDKAVVEWQVNESDAASHDAGVRAKAVRENLPPAGEARKLLRERAQERIKHWKTVLDCVKDNEELARLEFIEKHQYDLEVDPAQEAVLNRMQRYVASTSNRVNNLNRRLSNLKNAAAREKRHEDDEVQRRFTRDQKDAKKQAELREKLHREIYYKLKEEVLISQNLYTMPENWREHVPILHTIMTTNAMFARWSIFQLEDAPELIAFLEAQPYVSADWLRDVRHLLANEIQYRKEQAARQKRENGQA
jgi:hypothetical protein